MSRIYRVYKATTPPGKVYVGVTSQSLVRRRTGHQSAAKKAVPGRLHFWDALRKYGNQVQWEILEDNISGVIAAQDAERHYIKLLNSMDRSCGYNLTDGGHVLPESAHARLSEVGRCISAETRHQMSLSAKERGMSQHQLDNLALGHSPDLQRFRAQNSSKFQGHHHTEDARQRMSDAHRLIRHTAEQRRKIKEANWHPVQRSDGLMFASARDAARTLGFGDDAVAKALRANRPCGGFSFAKSTPAEFQSYLEVQK